MITPRQTRLLRVANLRALQGALVFNACHSEIARARTCAVIVPSRAAADQLLRTLENQILGLSGAVSPGRAFLLPELVTRAEWYDRLHERLDSPPRRLTPLEREVLIDAAAREAAAGGTPPPFRLRAGLLVEMLGLYDALGWQHRTVDTFERNLLGDLNLDAATDRGAERMLRQTRFLAATFRGYEARVAASGAVDEHALRGLLLQSPASRPLRHLIVAVADRAADPNGLWPADFDLLARLPLLERIDIIATEATLGSGFHERIHGVLPGIEECRFPADPVAAPAAAREPFEKPALLAPQGEPDELSFTGRDREEELADIARRFKQSVRAIVAVGAGVPPLERTAVVFKRPLPYVYLAREVFTAAGIPYQTVDALPLAAEPYAAALDLVFEFVTSGLTRSATIALLGSPHFTFEADGRRIGRRDVSALDRALSEAGYLGGRERLQRLAEELSSARMAEKDRSSAARAAHAAAAAARELTALGADEMPSVHLSSLLDFLAAHDDLPATDDPLRERALRARAAIHGALESLGRAHQQFDDTPRPFADVASTIRRWIEAQTFAPRAGSVGVQLLDAQAARFGDFDEVHLVGLVDGEWPQRAPKSIFYPQMLLKGLGWPEPTARLAAERAAFQDLLTLARERVAVSTFTLENDSIVSPSVLLEDLERASVIVSRVPKGVTGRIFVHEALSDDPLVPSAVIGPAAEWLALRSGRRDAGDAVFHGTADPHRQIAYAVSAVERYGECPFRFFAEKVLDLGEEPEDEPARSPKARGRFMHRVFRVFFEEWGRRGRRAITPDNLADARAVFAEVVEPLLKQVPDAEAAVERARLLGSAANEGLAETVFRIEAELSTAVIERLLEHPLGGEVEIACEEGVRRVTLRGVADRIDLLEDGTFRVFDYKLGRAPDLDRALQLPIYAVCAAQQLGSRDGKRRELAEAGYIAFGDPRRLVPMISRGGDRDSVIRDAQARLIRAIDGMARGEFPPRPADPFLCTSCPYAGVCRKDYVGDT